MKLSENKRFAALYELHLKLLKLQGKVKVPLMHIRGLCEGSKVITTVVLTN